MDLQRDMLGITHATRVLTARQSSSPRHAALHLLLELADVTVYLSGSDPLPCPILHDPLPPVGRYQRTGRDMQLRADQSRGCVCSAH
eukprot:6191278-Pleurochrysis_carterae.AAC.2